jgi:hypothetical protein
MLFSANADDRRLDGAIEFMVKSAYARVAVIASAVFCCSALWRAGLAVRHYRASINIIDDPSIREFEEVSAFFELGLAIILFGHAVVAAYLIRRPLQIDGIVVGAVAALAGGVIAGSLLQIPMLGATGLLPATLIPGCAVAGFFARSPWASSYLGALLGGFLGFYFGNTTFEPIVLLAVIVPPAIFALVGVALGRLLRRLGPSTHAA